MGLPGQLSSQAREQNKTDRYLRTLSIESKSSWSQLQEIGQGKQETGMAELGPYGEAVGQEENAQAMEAGTGIPGRV